MAIQITEKKLRTLVKESVKEVLDAELLKLRARLVPFVSNREQRDIERLYRRPSRKIAKTYIAKV